MQCQKSSKRCNCRYSPIKCNYYYKKWQKSRLLWLLCLPSSGTDILFTRPDYSDSWWSCSWSFLDYYTNYKLRKIENTMITKDTLVHKSRSHTGPNVTSKTSLKKKTRPKEYLIFRNTSLVSFPLCLATPCDLWGLSSLTRSWAPATRAQSPPVGHQGTPHQF